ncbi:MAG TPA: hypothetical protein VKE74_28350 [Gemmataceae bacterium]|nr:hypothetical protein [Gemmataceae bacterium]
MKLSLKPFLAAGIALTPVVLCLSLPIWTRTRIDSSHLNCDMVE